MQSSDSTGLCTFGKFGCVSSDKNLMCFYLRKLRKVSLSRFYIFDPQPVTPQSTHVSIYIL